MKTDGMWGSKHQGKMQICEMQDSHLISAIQYLRNNVIMPLYRKGKPSRRGRYMESLLDKWEDLLEEGHKRHLCFNSSQPAPDPDEFKGQTYVKRTPIQPPRSGRARAERSINL